ncbi:MAG TPA: two-component regulator propeller domain-containing protein [Gemmatimonadaceae bacterium]|nr:two-component regulator propeller domain-containing protein [Gemmatimonadaceae bacterium]
MNPSKFLAAAGLGLLAMLPAGRGAGAQRAPFSFERIAEERGLSNGTVTAIAQGTVGFLWFGTEDGLDRYDGTGFTVFRPVDGDTASLADAWVTSLAPSRNGSVWVGTLHGGVARRDARIRGFRRYQHVPKDPSSLANNQINTLLEARDGTLWVGTPSGLDALDTTTGRARHFIPAPTGDSARFSNDVISLLEIPGGDLWVGTRRGVYLLDRRTGAFQLLDLPLHTREIRALLFDRYGVVWVGTPDDLVAVEGRSKVVLHRYTRTAGTDSPVANGVNALNQGPDGTIWIGSDNGVVALDPAAGTFTRHTRDLGDPRSLGGPIVRSVLTDRGGVLWVGVESYGLSKHAPAAVTFDLLRHDPSNPRSLSDGYVRGISGDRQGNVWIGTQHGGLDRIDPSGRVRVYRHRNGDPHSLPGDNVWAFFEDHAGVDWVGLHEQGFGTFDPATGAFTRSPLVPADASVNVIYEDRAGTLYVGSEGRGLYAIAPDRRSVRTYGSTQGELRVLANNDVQSILEDRSGILWIGGADGLTRLDRAHGRVGHYYGKPGQAGTLGSSFVTDIMQDSRGTIWVATKGGGLNRFDERTGQFTSIGTAQGLPHSFIYGVLEDAHGMLWLSSDDGIAMYDPHSGLVMRYGLADGLQAREFNREAHYRAPDGTMYLGGINGVNVFHPDVLAAIPAPPRAVLMSLALDGVDRPIVGLTADSVVRLDHEGNTFTVSFAAPDFTAPEKIRFAYKLEGVDRDWVLAGDQHKATYASVPTGRHLLRVIASSPNGAWNTHGAAVTLYVAPAWWATWWARALELLAAAAVIFGIVRLREAAARRRSAELERRVEAQTRDLTEAHARLLQAQKAESLAILAGGVAHDFNNVLMSVVVGAELLEYQVAGNERAAETVQRIRTAGFRAAELTQQMLAYAGKGRVAVEKVDVARLVEDMLALVRATVPRTTELAFMPPAAPAVVEADATQLRQIIMNLATNAAEAIGDRAGHVTVRVDVEERPMRELGLMHAATDMPADGPYVVLDVADDGRGIEPAILSRIFDPFFTTKFTGRGLGLAALLGIVRGHHGGLTVITAPGEGTRFLIYLPRTEGAPASQTPATPPQAVPAVGTTRVLVADDEDDVREICKRILKELGYDVIVATDGAAAVALAEIREVDVFLLDVTMPKMNGAAAARALREKGFDAPIVLMSGYAEEDLLRRGITVDADAFLKKPFRASEVGAVLRKVVRTRSVA